ncbi:T9SS type B sorting domain-containing protein [Flavobacterium tegetincola]|uniref:T9SS type B sorting domain-containing protein n=1 Tax=Flavobacterium tegetincola TaxID=150172 RepID=UPI0003FA7E9D|nr:T9SS type B sorting domain-containing protein [Flavobacterium tegetincola]
MSHLRILLTFLFCTFATLSHSQLADFDLNVVVSDETCTNNGKLQISVSNTTAAATIVYRLYLAPDFTTSIAETTGATFSSLPAGNYRVVATQALGGMSNTATQNVVITNLIETLDFELSDTGAVDCDITAKIIVTVLTGNAVTYEILSGPVIRPLQSSNEFGNLPSGEYLIRVFDNCGDALSKAYTLVLGANSLTIGAPVLPEVYTSCTTVDITNTITTAASSILYPLLVTYTVYSPSGGIDQTYTQNIASGPANNLQLTQAINLFGSQIFPVKIEINDNCNNSVIEVFDINPNPKLTVAKFQDPCGKPYFTLTIKNYFPPYTLDFIDPTSFDPTLFNPAYPGPFTDAGTVFGDEDNTVPFGAYKVVATDGCDREVTLNFAFLIKPIVPNVTAANNGCDSPLGKITIKLPNDGTIVSISLTEAPSAYQGTLPQDVFSMVNAAGVYNGTNLPVGDYTFNIVDNCDNEIEVSVNIPEFVFGELVAETRPTCVPIFGSVKLSTTNGKLVTVSIIAAPSNYLEPLPTILSNNINADGNFYMSNLPPGTYTFDTVDLCGYSSQITVEIFGYSSTSDGLTVIRKCGAFDLVLNDTDIALTAKTFWLQKLNPTTNVWEHPYTGVAFIEGSIPTSATAKELINEATLFNVFLTGQFRVIKVFETFNNGNPNGKCSDLYAEFMISPELFISGAYNLNCIGGTGANDLVLNVIGVEPITYQITAPYTQDNGTNNVFTNLPQGIYNILATDDCGNIKNISVEMGTLLPLARASKPKNLLECKDDGSQFGTFNLTEQTPEILGNQEPANYQVTYHFTEADANADINPLPAGYTNVSNPQTIFARVEHKSIKLCYAVTSFKVVVGMKPAVMTPAPAFICENFTKKLTAENGFDAYEWSTGETTQSIVVNQPGTYTVTVKNVYDEFSCDASVNYIVTSSGPATIQSVETSDWSSNKNSATINVTGSGTYVYSLDNVNFQTSNTFTDLLPGFYTVYVKDINGCGTVKEDFVLLNYPKYFTPNGDGYNDTWHIRFSAYEPNLNVDIFDRFGKFIIRLKGGEAGWDGTYNGQTLFSTDYWFVVIREDGKVYRGHFSLKR